MGGVLCCVGLIVEASLPPHLGPSCFRHGDTFTSDTFLENPALSSYMLCLRAGFCFVCGYLQEECVNDEYTRCFRDMVFTFPHTGEAFGLPWDVCDLHVEAQFVIL